MGLATETRDEMLAVFIGRPLFVGLFEGDRELNDGRYQRVPVQFTMPEGDNERYIANRSEVKFEDFGRDHRVDHWGVFDGSGKLKAYYALSKPRDLPAEDNAVFRAGKLKIGLI
jgi:hypothetical protein